MTQDLTIKQRMALPRTEMLERPGDARAKDFEEVNLGFSWELAQLEAARCIECKRPTCIEGCPVGVRIDLFLKRLASGDVDGAAAVIAEDNLLPAICGRVCPQESQCEGACVLGRKGKPIAIGHLERYVADHSRKAAQPSIAPSGFQISVVGSGPAGLACAADLARSGHAVTVFEALHRAGGVLAYGIPEYRLPREVVDHEIEGLERMGVEIRTNVVIGRTLDLAAIRSAFDAVFIGVGAGLPRFIGIPGENLIGVFSANEFLTRVNLMRAHEPGSQTPVFDVRDKRVAVFGGGNTAMDGVRTALRMGAREASIWYRRTRAELPARKEEVRHAEEEGVRFRFLVSPLEFSGGEGRLRAVRFQTMELGEPDASGRRRPVPVAGDVREEPVDMAIIAIGNAPNPLLASTVPELVRSQSGTLEVDETTGQTSLPGVFAGGDIVTGGATVISAMGAGRRAAAAIGDYLAARSQPASSSPVWADD